MKKQIFFIFTLVVALMLTSCNASKNRLKGEVEKGNEECPIDMGMIGEISSLEYINDEVVMTFSINPQMPFDFSALSDMKDYIKKNTMGAFAKNAQSMTLMKEMKAAGSGMTIVFHGGTTNRTLKIKLTPEDVAQVAEGNVTPPSPIETLKYNINVTNEQCPMQVDQVTIMNNMSFEGKYVVYNYTIDEDYVSFDDIRQGVDTFRSNLLQNLHSNDPMLSMMIQQCKEAGYGLIYRYVGSNTKESLDIKFEMSEL